jgi:hypothetical protein
MYSHFDTNAGVTDNKFLSVSPKDPNSPSPVVVLHSNSVEKQTEPKDLVEVEDEGRVKIPSPISLWPKPLALQYRNFFRHYTTLTYKDTERMEAGSRLVVSLLDFYFPRGKFQFWRLEYQPKALIQSVPVEGTIYWAVVPDDRGSLTEDTTSVSESPLEVLPNENENVDSTMAQDKNLLVLLVVIVTETKFLHLPHRLTSTNLKFASGVSTSKGAIAIDSTEGTKYHHGNVLVLGGTGKPKMSPSWEFYNFDVDRGDGALLTPWFGQLESVPYSFGTNIFSLATPEAEKVDSMFRGIVSTASGNKAINPSSSELAEVVQAQVANREALKPHSQTVLNTTMTDDCLHSLRVNKAGRLQGEAGRFLSKEKEKEARAVARARGIRFQPYSYQVKSWRGKKEAKLAKENRVSMTPDVHITDHENYGGGRDEGYGSL